MRGWQARSLGPGLNSSMNNVFSIPSQIGEIKFEANAEYRFPIVWKLEGALFVDMGNIWNIPTDDEDYYDSELRFNTNALEALGLDWGLGVRLNLGLILVRVDGGFRVHDPGQPYGSRWLGPQAWFKSAYAVHFGVGYPF